MIQNMSAWSRNRRISDCWG